MKIQTPSRARLAPALSVLLVAGCSTISEPEGEVQLRNMIAGDAAPAWVTGQIPTSPGTVAFVGRGGGFDVLDERHAFDEALGHARTQLAHYVATAVTSEACLRDISIGARFLPRDMPEYGAHERVNQDLRSRAHEISDVIVGGVAAADQHWERWDVSNGRQWDRRWMTDRRAGIQRYKCWVLAIVDLDTIDRYVASALRAVENEASANANAQQTLNASAHELQRLRERVHYGRRFRLTGIDDCLHFRADCDFNNHPEWRTVEVACRDEGGCCELCDLGIHGG
jgi:hypothetical protein